MELVAILCITAMGMQLLCNVSGYEPNLYFCAAYCNTIYAAACVAMCVLVCVAMCAACERMSMTL